jgi:hypothetical protein
MHKTTIALTSVGRPAASRRRTVRHTAVGLAGFELLEQTVRGGTSVRRSRALPMLGRADMCQGVNHDGSRNQTTRGERARLGPQH